MLLVLGSASLFLAMIVARKTLSPGDLYFWNALVTMVSMGFTFCFFGTEQLFLRFSIISKVGQVDISRSTLHLMGGGLFFFTAILAVISEAYLFQLGWLILYPILGISVGSFVFVYNFQRVRKSFSEAQLAANGWKFTILIGLFLAPLGDAQWILVCSFGLAFLGVACLFWRDRDALKIRDTSMPFNWRKLFLGFFLSLLVLLLLNNADRLIIARYGSKELFSDYVYVVTLLVMPFGLLSNYVGFRELARLKDRIEPTAFLRKALRGSVLTASLFVIWFGTIFALQTLLEVSVDVCFAVPCLAIATSRFPYAMMSALIALEAGPEQLYLANIMTLMFLTTSICVILYLGVSIVSMLWLVCLFWLARFCIFYIIANKILQEKSHQTS